MHYELFTQVAGGIATTGVPSTYTLRAGIVRLKNCKFGVYPVAGACFKYCETLFRIQRHKL